MNSNLLLECGRFKIKYSDCLWDKGSEITPLHIFKISKLTPIWHISASNDKFQSVPSVIGSSGEGSGEVYGRQSIDTQSTASEQATSTVEVGNTISGSETPPAQQTKYLKRETWITQIRNPLARQEFVKLPTDNYLEMVPLRVTMGTWNVNGRALEPDLDLKSWMLPDDHKPDLLVFGFQELVALNGTNTLLVADLAIQSKWEALIDVTLNGPQRSRIKPEVTAESGFVETIPEPKKYVAVSSRQLVGVYLSVWVRSDLMAAVSDVRVTSVATGWGGYLGNKGTVAIRLTLYETTLCFLSSHFQSGENEGDELKRNQDYHESVRRGIFPEASGGGEVGILEHDVVAWLGDFNYRMNAPDSLVRELIAAQDWTHLLVYDQLTAERHKEAVFSGFGEGPLTFPPTYKYRLGSSAHLGEYVGSEDPVAEGGAVPEGEKKRTPAWCDRILWRGYNLKQLAYAVANPSPTQSDHRPVVGVFRLECECVNPSKAELFTREAYKIADAMEMSLVPKARISCNDLDFGVVDFGAEGSSRTVVLENDGETDAHFFFLTDIEGAPLLPPWLHIKPDSGMVPPGGRVELEMRARVDAASAQCLMRDQGGRLLQAVMVLRIVGGNDMFIATNGSYRGSCFGVDLEETQQVQSKTSTSDVEVDGTGNESVSVNHPPDQILHLVAGMYRLAKDESVPIPKDIWEIGPSGLNACSNEPTPSLLGKQSFSDLISMEPETRPENADALEGADVCSNRASQSAEAGAIVDLEQKANSHSGVGVEDVRKLLDGGADADELLLQGVDFKAMLHTLLAFFQSLPEPLIANTQESISQVCESVYFPGAEAACSAIHEQLGPVAYATFYVVVHLLRYLVRSERCSLGDAAAVFARVWFAGERDKMVTERRARLVELFIDLDEDMLYLPLKEEIQDSDRGWAPQEENEGDRAKVHSLLGIPEVLANQ